MAHGRRRAVRVGKGRKVLSTGRARTLIRLAIGKIYGNAEARNEITGIEARYPEAIHLNAKPRRPSLRWRTWPSDQVFRPPWTPFEWETPL